MRLHREIVNAIERYEAQSLSDGSIQLRPVWTNTADDAIPFGFLDRQHIAERVAALVNAQLRRQRRKGNP